MKKIVFVATLLLMLGLAAVSHAVNTERQAWKFQYTFANGDLYTGLVLDPWSKYTTGQTWTKVDEHGRTGTYAITNKVVKTFIDEYGPADGSVYLNTYYDAETNLPFSPLNQSKVAGTGDIGSEVGYLKNAGVNVYKFGMGFYEADAGDTYTYRYTYNNGTTSTNGDYYEGKFYRDPLSATYYPGQKISRVNELGKTGYYEIKGVSHSNVASTSYGQIFVSKYYDGDTIGKNVPVVDPTTAKGTNFLGSELGYLKNAGVAVYKFGMGFFEADAGDTYTYRYTYNNGTTSTNGDYYEGKFYRDPLSATYYPGQKISRVNELGKTGYYEIKGVSHSNVASTSYGQIFVSKYYDGDTIGKNVPVVDPTTAKGTNFLGSELGYLKNAGVAVYKFGMGFFEADAGDTYTYRYTYNNGTTSTNGDYYEGKFYRDPLSATYYPGQKISRVNELGKTGYYEIKGVSHSNVAATSYGQIFVSKYYDGDTIGKNVPVVDPTTAKGTNFLGSELGYLKNAGVAVYKFGMGFFEADAGDTYTYRYTYNNGTTSTNGDYYEGKFYRDPMSATYYPGQKISRLNELKLTGYYEIKGVSHSNVASTSYGQIFVSKYYDGDTIGKNVPVVDPTTAKGTNFLGSELGYLKNAGVAVYNFGMGFFEADAGDTYTFRYTYTNGDYYEGKFYRDPLSATYYPGQKISRLNELKLTGYYEIKGVSHSNVAATSYGQIFVNKYYDGDTIGKNVSVVDPTTAKGTNFLGSELGYIKNAGVAVYKFGMGFFEADAGNTYTFRYTYGNGDYYEGKVYRDPLSTVYYPGYKLNIVNELKFTGYYEIKGVSYTNLDSDIAYGKVYVTKYYDGDKANPKSYTGAQLLPADPAYPWFGAYYLGSELGYIGARTTSVSPNYFGKGIYEADL